ncbi:mutator type transposase [Tanacetum coccineum]
MDLHSHIAVVESDIAKDSRKRQSIQQFAKGHLLRAELRNLINKREDFLRNHNIEAYDMVEEDPTQQWSSFKLKWACWKLKVDWNGSDLYQVTCPWGDQFVVNISERVCSYRKWELSGIPYTHAVAAIWDQANNGTDIGIPESYCNPYSSYNHYPPKNLTHRLATPKKRKKKSATELADEIMKSKKLTSTGKSVTCSLCKQVGHNQRGCKSKKSGDAGAGSQGGGMLVLVHKRVEMRVLVTKCRCSEVYKPTQRFITAQTTS